MPHFLKIESGPRSGTMLAVAPGISLRVGRTSQATFAVPEDDFLSRVHFEVAVEGSRCMLRDLNSANGTTCNGVPVAQQTELRGGETIVAGRTHFSIVVERDAPSADEPTATMSVPSLAPPPLPPPPPVAPPVAPPDRTPLLALLQQTMQPLYAVLDAAQAPEVLKSLLHSGAPCYSLLWADGTARLANFAPYLVALAPASPLLPFLVTAAWGKNWGVFLRSELPFANLHAWLQRLLILQPPDGSSMLLRFYDPRVLRELLPICTAQQLRQIFALTTLVLVESDDPAFALAFALDPRGLLCHALPVASAEPVQTVLFPEVPPTPPHAPPPSLGLLSLSPEQLEKLGAKADPFEASVLEFLENTYPAQVEAQGRDAVAAMIHAGIGRARRYGMQADDEVRKFIVLMLLLGAEFDTDPRLPWAATILGKRKPPAEKIVLLEAEARKPPPA